MVGFPIFDELYNSGKHAIEDNDSNFNVHRMDVIKYSVERNLSIAISNFNKLSSLINDFEMPRLKDSEWEKISRNVAMISFLQGLSVGGKMYNGYAIVNNNKNEEFVAEESIYIETTDGQYHRVKCEDLKSADLTNAKGYFNIDYEAKPILYEKEGVNNTPGYLYQRDGKLACYSCIVQQDKVDGSSMQEYLKVHKDLAKVYYTALARERYGMYRVENSY